jgi:hypothetical protein
MNIIKERLKYMNNKSTNNKFNDMEICNWLLINVLIFVDIFNLGNSIIYD